jgi:hypothetical protein
VPLGWRFNQLIWGPSPSAATLPCPSTNGSYCQLGAGKLSDSTLNDTACNPAVSGIKPQVPSPSIPLSLPDFVLHSEKEGLVTGYSFNTPAFGSENLISKK